MYGTEFAADETNTDSLTLIEDLHVIQIVNHAVVSLECGSYLIHGFGKVRQPLQHVSRILVATDPICGIKMLSHHSSSLSANQLGTLVNVT